MNNAPLPFSFPVPHGQFFVFLWPVLFLQCASLIKKVLKFVWSHLFFLYRLPCVFYWSCKRFKVAWFVYVTKLFTQRFTVIYTSKLVWLIFLCGTQTMLETYSLSHHSLYCKMLWTWMGVLLSLARKMYRFETTTFIMEWTIPSLFLIYWIRDTSVTFLNNFVSRAFWSWLDKRSVEWFESRMKSDSVRK